MVDRPVGVGAGENAASPDYSTEVGEGVTAAAEVAAFNITATKSSSPAIISPQDHAVDPAKTTTPSGPAAMALPSSYTAPAEPPRSVGQTKT